MQTNQEKPNKQRLNKQNSNTSVIDIFLIFLRLGLTSFGGPVAHLGYFRHEFVSQKKWLSEQSYADLVSLCQFLPGPASSQVGLAIGFFKNGYAGAAAAWLGFTLPSAILLILFALGLSTYSDFFSEQALHGLKIVAVAVVAQAVWGMARSLCTNATTITIMMITTVFILLMPTVWSQVGVIILAGIAGLILFKPKATENHEQLPIKIGRQSGITWLIVFFVLLIGLPFLAESFSNPAVALTDSFYRSGSLVFGGGHVVLPLLQAEVVPTELVDKETFLAGYGATQAVPGPLFTFAAFLGASLNGEITGWTGGLLCLVAIFIPSFLLVAGALPFWEKIRHNNRTQAALIGVNASVVGILLAAFYDPVWTSAIFNAQDFAFALVAFIALQVWKLPPWLVVIGSGFIAFLLGMIF